MAPLSTALFYFGILVFTWSSCSAKSTVEEQLQKLKKNYEAMDAKNIQLETKIKQLEAKDAQLEELVKQNNQKNSASLKGTRDAAIIDSTINISNATSRQGLTTKMPTSCLDLKSIGHQLNGVYSVIGAKYVETVYCDFSKLAFDASFQTLIGFTDVKSAPIHFYVKRSFVNQTNTPITFSEELLNVGGAMNSSAGIFTAPKTGTYFFYFSGLAWFPESLTRININIALKLNGNKITYGSADEVSVRGKYQSVSLPSTISLKSGDKIWYEIDQMSSGVFLNGNGRTHFTGGLLEEEIFASL